MTYTISPFPMKISSLFPGRARPRIVPGRVALLLRRRGPFGSQPQADPQVSPTGYRFDPFSARTVRGCALLGQHLGSFIRVYPCPSVVEAI